MNNLILINERMVGGGSRRSSGDNHSSRRQPSNMVTSDGSQRISGEVAVAGGDVVV